MKIIHDLKKYKKFEKDSNKNPAIGMKFKYFCMYAQLAEACENGYHLSQQPWKWRKFHKLSGNRSNEYSFAISKTDRTKILSLINAIIKTYLTKNKKVN